MSPLTLTLCLDSWRWPECLLNLNWSGNHRFDFQEPRFDSSNKGKKNKIYEHLKKEIEIRNKRQPTKEEIKNQVFFVDKVCIIYAWCMVFLHFYPRLETLPW